MRSGKDDPLYWPLFALVLAGLMAGGVMLLEWLVPEVGTFFLRVFVLLALVIAVATTVSFMPAIIERHWRRRRRG